MKTATCYRHRYRAEVATGSCCRCGRLVCDDCGVPAPVGRHCPDCARQAEAARSPRPALTGQLRPSALVKALIAVNAVIFLFQLDDPTIVLRYGDNPLLVASGDYFRLVTAAFLHANLFHLLFNMGALLIFGSQVEALIGPARFMSIYLLAALGGSTCSMLFQPALSAGFGVGASGAVFGLLGAYIAIARAHKLEVRPIIGLIIVNLAYGLIEPAIDNWAHIGGLATGIAVGAALVAAQRVGARWRTLVQAGAVLVVFALLAGVIDARATDLRQTILFLD